MLGNAEEQPDLVVEPGGADNGKETSGKGKRPRRQIPIGTVIVGVCGIVGAACGAIFLPYFMESISKGIAQLITNTGIRTATPYNYTNFFFVYFMMGLFGLIVGGGLGAFAVRVVTKSVAKWEKLETGDKVDVFLGVFAGIILSFPFYVLFQGLGQVITPFITIFLSLGLASVSVYVLKAVRDVLPWHSGKAGTAVRRSGIKILDTNVLIDGRLYDIVKAGFLEGELYVPQFVLLELQTIADASDVLRRQRGRRGLEVLKRLQSDYKVTVGDHDKHAPDDREPVDSRLVRIAKALGADLVSNDFNLNRVARIQEVSVLSINDLAIALRPTVLPGETMMLPLIREGSQYGQAVGYLDDGTMVVVEGGRQALGETVEVSVSQVIQTERGKMIFATYDENENGPPTSNGGNKRRGR